MAKAHPQTRCTKSDRFIKVSHSVAPGRMHPIYGAPVGTRINLDGHWLRKAGFPADMRIRVQVEPGKLVITPV